MNAKIESKQIFLLVDALDQGYDKPAWHGTNFRNSLRGLKLPQLLWRPAQKRHNIWEIALHVAYWKYVIRRRIVGGKKGAFPRKPSNFPRIPLSPTTRDWKDDLTLLEESHTALRKTIIELPDSKLHRRIAKSETSYAQIIYGAASHDLYHAGQVMLLRRLQKK